MAGFPYDKAKQLDDVRLFRIVTIVSDGPYGGCYLQQVADVDHLTRAEILDQLERIGSRDDEHLLVTGKFEIVKLTELTTRKAEVRPG